MNLRNVLSAYSKLRQLTDDETALLETLRGMSETERESLVLALQPEKTAGKRASKKSSKGASKSPRASGMAAALKQNLNRQRQAIDRDYQPCQYHDGNLTCGAKEDNTIHDPTMGYAGYHEFQPAASSVAHEAGAGG